MRRVAVPLSVAPVSVCALLIHGSLVSGCLCGDAARQSPTPAATSETVPTAAVSAQVTTSSAPPLASREVPRPPDDRPAPQTLPLQAQRDHLLSVLRAQGLEPGRIEQVASVLASSDRLGFGNPHASRPALSRSE